MDSTTRLNTALAGRYEIKRELGQGGMATVYLARDVRHERDVAIKVLKPELAAAVGADRFVREIRLAAKLTHPHILPLFDSGEADGLLYYVMPLVEGESLRDRIEVAKQLAVDEAISVAREVADALDYAHRHDVVHRDIKPENILLHDGHAVVADFGIGKAVTAASGDSSITQTGVTIGTPAYMSPEQAAGDPDIDGRSDLYSLGCVMYEMLTGEQPFTGPTVQAVIAKRFANTPPAITRARPTVSPVIADAVAKLLQRTPADRFATGAQLVAAFKAGLATASVAAAPRQADEKSIAVLPFANMSADAENEFFSDGITEEIINALVQVPDLKVAARTSVFAFKGKADDLRAIAEKLSVRNVLEGSVRKAGNRIRITAQLIKASDGYHIWSEKFDRDLTDVFAVQDEIARAIAETLKSKLSGAGDAPIVKRTTDDMEAYELYLKGRHFIAQRGKGIAKALGCFEAALAKDPAFAEAHTGVADACSLLGFYGVAPSHVVMKRALDAADRAIALDASLAEAYCARGFVEQHYLWDVVAAKASLRKAIALKPSLVQAYYWLASATCTSESFAVARAFDEEAVRIDPLSTFANAHVGWMYLGEGRTDDAAKQLERTLEIDENAVMAHWLLGQARMAQGHTAEAIDSLRRAVAISGGLTWMESTLASGLAIAGQAEESRTILASLLERAKTEHVGHELLAMNYAYLGEIDRSLEWLDRARETRSTLICYMMSPGAEAMFGMSLPPPVRSDPRYAVIWEKAGVRL